MKYIEIVGNCKFCAKAWSVRVEKEGYEKSLSGACIQDALPNLSANDRELIISSVCATCWEDMFDEGDDA